MARVTIDELYRELDATDESYIRRKLVIGGYSPTHVKHVQAWLAQREAERAEQRLARDSAVSNRTAFWTMVGAFGGVGAVVVAIATMVATKVS